MIGSNFRRKEFILAYLQSTIKVRISKQKVKQKPQRKITP